MIRGLLDNDINIWCPIVRLWRVSNESPLGCGHRYCKIVIWQVIDVLQVKFRLLRDQGSQVTRCIYLFMGDSKSWLCFSIWWYWSARGMLFLRGIIAWIYCWLDVRKYNIMEGYPPPTYSLQTIAYCIHINTKLARPINNALFLSHTHTHKC